MKVQEETEHGKNAWDVKRKKQFAIKFYVTQGLTIHQTLTFNDIGWLQWAQGPNISFLHPLSSVITPNSQVEQLHLCK